MQASVLKIASQLLIMGEACPVRQPVRPTTVLRPPREDPEVRGHALSHDPHIGHIDLRALRPLGTGADGRAAVVGPRRVEACCCAGRGWCT